METFAPLINLLTLLAVLSLVSERVTNAVKLHRKELREKAPKGKEKEREKRITAHALFLSFVVALVVNANFFEILTHLEAPWETLGWAQLQAGQLVQTSTRFIVPLRLILILWRLGKKRRRVFPTILEPAPPVRLI